MPQDECRDCSAHYPAGKGLKGGRCPICYPQFVARREDAGLTVSTEDSAET